ncbi:hypothetical protein FLK61_33775 [Paenalkalicoccus suaedae]|uniref:Uncharacterized protein n=1 Tax=Paenalkalicoccus suaedae TaxID=2592382 RepID=A0A859FG97_9BACI|nr:hypothetical protein [Paenalkalicoccus suaedae]QKS71654.1 hypothetical protein FLK61_33775 [Paenalkalicoccus suaedae]
MLADKLRYAGGGIPRELYLYELFNNNAPFIQGFAEGAGSLSFPLNGRMLINARRLDISATRTAVTEVAFDLSPYSKAYIDWENQTSGGLRTTGFVIMNQRDVNPRTTNLAEVLQTGNFARRTDEIDISSFNGEFFYSCICQKTHQGQIFLTLLRYLIYG